MKFHLTIQLGNAEMETLDDVAHVLARLAEELEEACSIDDHLPLKEWRGQHIRDVNGNRVGTWEVTP